jgi:transcription elongation factor
MATDGVRKIIPRNRETIITKASTTLSPSKKERIRKDYQKGDRVIIILFDV